MKSLRARLAGLILIAIVAVVLLASFAASSAYRSPLPEATTHPLARQIHLLISLAFKDRDHALEAGIRLGTEAAPGRVYHGSTQKLADALAQTGESYHVVVTREEGSPLFRASVDLSNGDWLIVDVPELNPPVVRVSLLIGWIVLIVVGSAIVAILVATKVLRPVQLIEDAVSKIGSDGMLPEIPVSGSGELRATADALNRLSRRLKSAVESRMRLVAAAGHDLRTPMTRMRLRAEFVEDEAERTKWLADIEELDQIAESAIYLVREEVTRDPLEPVDVIVLIRRIIDQVAALGHQVAAELPDSLQVVAAPMALKRALRNLVVNAAVHGGNARITAIAFEDHVSIVITDDGPGIPQEMLGQVFEPFFRVDSARRKDVQGAGLGLAIAREIIERFGGKISIANRAPRGLIQVVRLPHVG